MVVTYGATSPANGGNKDICILDLTMLNPGEATQIIPTDESGAPFIFDRMLFFGTTPVATDTIILGSDGTAQTFNLEKFVNTYGAVGDVMNVGLGSVIITMDAGNGEVMLWKDPRTKNRIMG